MEFRFREPLLGLRCKADHQQQEENRYPKQRFHYRMADSDGFLKSPFMRYAFSTGTLLIAFEGQSRAMLHSLQFWHRLCLI
jgi:hypothetical protein